MELIKLIDKNKDIKNLVFQIGQKDGGLDRPLYWKTFGLTQKSVANTKKQWNLLGK